MRANDGKIQIFSIIQWGLKNGAHSSGLLQYKCMVWEVKGIFRERSCGQILSVEHVNFSLFI
jgi:hypothetical protein